MKQAEIFGILWSVASIAGMLAAGFDHQLLALLGFAASTAASAHFAWREP